MLRHLSIRNVVLIEALDLDFGEGLTVLTGETGAGKSILLDALGLVCGIRADSSLVREGAQQAIVSAQFDLDIKHPVYETCAELGLQCTDGEMVLRRIVEKDGRSKAFVNDQPVTIGGLRRIGRTLVEVHGQHDDNSLLNPAAHRILLDTFANIDPALLGKLWGNWKAAQKALSEYQIQVNNLQEDTDYVSHALKELEALSPQMGEDEALDTRRRLMQASERVSKDIMQAARDISRDGAEGLLYSVQKRLLKAQDLTDDLLHKALEALGRALGEVAETAEEIESALQKLEFNPSELEIVEERLFELRRLARKYNVQTDDLPALQEKFAVRLNAVEHSGENILALEQAVDTAQSVYAETAYTFHAQREAAAKILDAQVMEELPALRMQHAMFQTQVDELPLAQAQQDGLSKVVFTARTNPGSAIGPIDRIASGGELSRFLLALKVCLVGSTDAERPTVMVFDEIDRGVGGATANAVGARLQALAEQGQVLVITHSPQVAAKGHNHWHIEKQVGTDDGIARTYVRPLENTQRVQELARMLAGEDITPEAESAAKSLLKLP